MAKDTKCYLELLNKIELMDMQIKRIKSQLTELKGIIHIETQQSIEEKEQKND